MRGSRAAHGDRLLAQDSSKPRVRPFGTVNIYDGKLYIQTGKNKKKNVSHQTAKNLKAGSEILPDEPATEHKALAVIFSVDG